MKEDPAAYAEECDEDPPGPVLSIHDAVEVVVEVRTLGESEPVRTAPVAMTRRRAETLIRLVELG